MNVDKLQQQIHVLYEGDPDYPINSSDEDFQIRLSLINLAIHEWEQTPNVLWRELAVWLVDEADTTAERTIVANQNKYTCPSNFSKMYEGIVYIGKTKILEIPIEKRQTYVDSLEPVFYISGNRSDGYYLNLLNVNTSSLNNQTINYLYCKSAKNMETPSDVPQCSDPNYIIHRVVSELYAQDSDPKATKELAMSQNLLSALIVRNAVPSLHEDNTYVVYD